MQNPIKQFLDFLASRWLQHVSRVRLPFVVFRLRRIPESVPGNERHILLDRSDLLLCVRTGYAWLIPLRWRTAEQLMEATATLKHRNLTRSRNS